MPLLSAIYSDLCVLRVATDRFGWRAFSLTGTQHWNQRPVTIPHGLPATMLVDLTDDSAMGARLLQSHAGYRWY